MQRSIRILAELVARPLLVAILLLVLAPTRAPSNAALPHSPETHQATQQAVTDEVAKLLADDSAENRSFGEAIDVSHDTVVVGAYRDSGNGYHSGAAYVFVRNQGGADEWNQVAKLTAGDAAPHAQFGYDVAISGDTIVVGASGDDSYTGAAYIFERNQDGPDNWGQVQKLSGSSTYEYFGHLVDISGDTLVIGVPSANSYDGTAYIFERNQDGADNWGRVCELVPTTPAGSNAQFGRSVAIEGGTVVVGASHADPSDSGAAYVFERNQGGADTWGEVQKITGHDTVDADHFGYAVDIGVDTIVVGAFGHNSDAGAAYVFERNQDGADNWGQVRKLTAADAADGDRFGWSAAIDGGTVIVGAHRADDRGEDAGAVYVFGRNHGGGDNWGQIRKLSGSDTEAGDYFGMSVAISGHTVVAGAPQHEDVGAAYVFVRRGARWRRERKRLGDDTAGGDLFGSAVAVSGDTLVAGAPYEDDWGDYAGAAYVFARNEGSANGWGQMTRLSIASSDHYELGSAVDISGDTFVVGMPGGDRAFVGERNQGIVTAVFGTSSTKFSQAVAVSGDTVVVGAPNESAQGHTQAGTAYVYTRNRDGADQWGLVTTLDAGTFAEDGDHFGNAVAISGDTIAVGAYYADPDGNNAAGAAYVFERNFGGADNWGQARRLLAGDADGGEWFGRSVAIDNDTIVVGAPLETGSSYGDGAAYVFERNWGGCADIWNQVHKLTASDADGGDYFGWTVDVSFDIAVVGAYLDDSAGSDAGAVYVFERNAGGADTWGQVGRITAQDAAADDHFGKDASISGNVIAIGANQDDDAGSGSGAATIYRWQAAQIYLPLALRGYSE
jgi:hypothetical protein